MVSCASYRKNRDPKCNDQKDCEWVKKKGCKSRKLAPKKSRKAPSKKGGVYRALTKEECHAKKHYQWKKINGKYACQYKCPVLPVKKVYNEATNRCIKIGGAAYKKQLLADPAKLIQRSRAGVPVKNDVKPPDNHVVKCKGLKKTKAPKCNDQPNCEWIKKKGCQTKADAGAPVSKSKPVVSKSKPAVSKSKPARSRKCANKKTFLMQEDVKDIPAKQLVVLNKNCYDVEELEMMVGRSSFDNKDPHTGVTLFTKSSYQTVLKKHKDLLQLVA